jgi:hypothetical protein
MTKHVACCPLRTVKEQFQAEPLSSKLSPSMGSTMTVSWMSCRPFVASAQWGWWNNTEW